MFVTIIEIVLPALVVFTTLFGLLARGNPKPGGVALFFRVGAVGLLLGGVLWYVVERSGLLPTAPEVVVNAYRGLAGGGVLLLAFAAFGVALKKPR